MCFIRGVEIDEHFSLISLFTFLILFLLWFSLNSRGRRRVMYTFVTLFFWAEHGRPFATSFGVFSSMLLVPQWITICLIAGGHSSFSALHNKFSTLSPRIPQFNVSFPKNEFHTFVIWRVLELLSRPVILSVYFCLHLMLTYVVGVIYAIPVCKNVSRVLMFATVRSYILTIRGHSLVRVSICYSSLWNVVLL